MKLLTYLNPNYDERSHPVVEPFGAWVEAAGGGRVLDFGRLSAWLNHELSSNERNRLGISHARGDASLADLLRWAYSRDDRDGTLTDNAYGLPRTLAALQPSYSYFLEHLADDPVAVNNLTYDPATLTILAPIPRPNSIRDFYAFRQHVETARRNRGLPMIEEWFQFPAFYFTNHNAVIGPDVPVAMPQTNALDYELEVACVIGKPGRDIPAADALGYIAGYMIMNDWSARDVQAAEMKVGLGPAKAKDFATSLGPYLVTPDELADRRVGDGAEERYDLRMTARVNGELRSEGNLRDIHYSFSQLIAHASRDVWLYPGDVIASGTVGSGCLLELTAGRGPWLQAGDVVELEVERLGVLRNEVKSEK